MRTGNYESSDKSTAGTAVTFLLIGLGAGALVALLLAPKTGKQMRRDLRRKYDDVRETVEDFAEEAKERVIDVMALMGDTVDNIPGAKGIGEKGATELIQKYGSVEKALEKADEVPNKRYREALQ